MFDLEMILFSFFPSYINTRLVRFCLGIRPSAGSQFGSIGPGPTWKIQVFAVLFAQTVNDYLQNPETGSSLRVYLGDLRSVFFGCYFFYY